MFKREINFAKHPIRILGRRYTLTKTSYKYIDIAIVVKRESYVDIALGDCHGKEISLTADMWRDLLATIYYGTSRTTPKIRMLQRPR